MAFPVRTSGLVSSVSWGHRNSWMRWSGGSSLPAPGSPTQPVWPSTSTPIPPNRRWHWTSSPHCRAPASICAGSTCHTSTRSTTSGYLSAVLETGATLGFDSFGQDFYFTAEWKAKSDLQRLEMLARLIDAGFEDQLVVGQDICMKCMLKSFGGMGYDHVIRRVMPRFRDVFGVPEHVIDKLLVANPRRLLTVNAPS